MGISGHMHLGYPLFFSHIPELQAISFSFGILLACGELLLSVKLGVWFLHDLK
jgi:hypothetical protein